MKQNKEPTLKELIQWYLDRMDEENPEDADKLKLIYQLIDRVFIGKKILWY